VVTPRPADNGGLRIGQLKIGPWLCIGTSVSDAPERHACPRQDGEAPRGNRAAAMGPVGIACGSDAPEWGRGDAFVGQGGPILSRGDGQDRWPITS